MKKLLVIVLGLLVAATMTVSAAKGQKKQLTPEQDKLKKEMMEKYDANKDGKIDADESAKISRDDKKKMKDAGVRIARGKKKK